MPARGVGVRGRRLLVLQKACTNATDPVGVYFTALPIRLIRICRRCVGSVRTRGRDAPTVIEKASPFSLTSDSSSLATFSTNGRSTMVSACTSSRPAAILAISST